MRHFFKLFLSIAAVFITFVLIQEFFQDMNISEETIDVVSDFFPIFVSFSIFALTWYSYGKSKDNHALFMGFIFLGIGLIDFVHMLSLPFMPDLITPNGHEKSLILYNEARLFSAVFFLAGAYIYKDTVSKIINRPFLLASAAVLSIISLFPAYYLEQSYSISGSSIIYIRQFVTTAIISYTCYVYSRRSYATGEKHFIYLIDGFVFLIFSDLFYVNFEIPAHFLKLAGFVLIHLALYRSSVELPYDKLAEAEDRLRMAAEDRYRNLFDNASDAIVTVDREERITSWNPAAEKIFGWFANEIIGKQLSDILIPQDKMGRKENIVRSALSGCAVSGIDVIIPHKNGTFLNMSLSVSPIMDGSQNIIGLSGIMRDITERKKAEEALRGSEEKYRSLVESTDDSIYMVDRDCRYLFINSRHLSRLGIEDYRGKNYRDIHPEDRVRTFTHRVSCVFEKGEPQQCEYESDGKWFHQTLSPIKDPRTGVVTAVAAVNVVSTDITARKKAERIILENERLASASRTKSEFLANMSHELRTPLNSIIGFSELLKMNQEGEMGVKQQKYVDNVLTSGKFLLNIINDILDLSKVEAGKIELSFEKMPVHAVVDETLNLIKESALKRNIFLKKEFDPALGFIEADPQRFKQILFNLLSNAVKFNKKEGGTVTITTKKNSLVALISVADTGIGIKEEDMGRLFREFEQLDSGYSRAFGGTGLGLSISKKLVELHGGEITVKSTVGEGSSFTFSLPLAAKNGRGS